MAKRDAGRSLRPSPRARPATVRVTYGAICRGAADDPELLDLMARAPVTQRRPNLLLAAVHFLLLGGAAHPLGTHYDTVGGLLGTDGTDPVGGPSVTSGSEFKDFCLTHREELLELIARGSTQTNEVGRCTRAAARAEHIAAGYDRVSLWACSIWGPRPACNLLFDRYAYTYRRRDDRRDGDGRPVLGPDDLEAGDRPRPCGSSAPCAAGSRLAAFPGAARRSPAGRASTAPRSTPVTKRGPAGSWPACGRITCPASPASAAALEIARRSPPTGPAHRRHGRRPGRRWPRPWRPDSPSWSSTPGWRPT